MSISVGDIVEGKVTGITKFGAFVTLEDGSNGLVHISEISNEYVEKVEDFIKKDDKVKVKVLSTKDGKISLSMKTTSKKVKQPEEFKKNVENSENDEMSFEDKISKFLKDSNERYVEIRTRENKRKRNGSKNY
ncbi:S1 RNA-binding domain-containing protein [Miniphocaeibacter halophilus]|uniref:S1 RNA-binding domain-containing protein n=1 Tax=Miniphocaeibacter halophilus TaxID=2931922 RepID=A0AC61MVU0_9FIRM|nr:S1 RNA-binding domain-containing protein [Miniphocaeibacter halophilus]QQK07938.1 S1 RNA-binding domain-containing protein [Miniphocaeibacter halophilus]